MGLKWPKWGRPRRGYEYIWLLAPERLKPQCHHYYNFFSGGQSEDFCNLFEVCGLNGSGDIEEKPPNVFPLKISRGPSIIFKNRVYQEV